jgi:DNA-binding protein YbaB
MADLPVPSDKLKIKQIDEQLKIELKQFYEDLNSQAININWGDGKIVMTISGTQIFQSVDISEDWLIHSKKQEIENQLFEGINYALSASLESGNKKLADFYQRMINSSPEIKRLVQSGAAAETTGNIMKVNEAVKAESVQEKSIHEDVVVVFAGGRRLVFIAVSQELLNTKDSRVIGVQLVDVLNKAIKYSRNKLMNKFGPAS